MKKECGNSKVKIIKRDSGEIIDIPCKSWSCPVCAPKKKFRLNKYFASQLLNYEVVRMMTVGLRVNLPHSSQSHYGQLQEIWRRFITEIRREKKIKGIQKIKYLRINEMHKSGFTHMHILVDTFIPQKWALEKLNKIALIVLGIEEKKQQISVHLELIQDNRKFSNNGLRNLKNIENYLTKKIVYYTTKTFDKIENRPYKKIWSRSAGFENIPRGKKIDGDFELKIFKLNGNLSCHTLYLSSNSTSSQSKQKEKINLLEFSEKYKEKNYVS